MVGLELGGRDVPDLAVRASVVEPVDVLGERRVRRRSLTSSLWGMVGLRMTFGLNSEFSTSASPQRLLGRGRDGGGLGLSGLEGLPGREAARAQFHRYP